MSRLAQQQEVFRLAAELGLAALDPMNEISGYCVAKIKGWLKGRDDVRTIGDVERIVCEKLQLGFEEVGTDEDLVRVAKKYVQMGEPVFATIKGELDPSTFAILLERHHNVTNSTRDRYVAVIDCRGDKAQRRFFTRWHEIAHLLTKARQLELPFHRSIRNKDPIESLMDAVAGEVGFYDPIFRPVLSAEMRKSKRLTFAAIERIRDEVCPDASFQSTMIACVKRVDIPLVYLEAGMGLKKGESDDLASGQQYFLAPPQPKLRVLVVVPNDAAKTSRLTVHRNMQVPEESLVAGPFLIGVANGADSSGSESLAIWKHSNGDAVGTADVRIEARKLKDRVIAIMSLAS